jgi:formate dehydrogenase subunit beta
LQDNDEGLANGGVLMGKYWSLDTHGDPLGKVREFVRRIWLDLNLDGMLVTVSSDEYHATPRFVTDVSMVEQINPFKPLMEINAARLVPRLLQEHPNSKVGAVLRPCEMRAMIEMAKHAPFNTDNLLTICVDCLGTLPADEYQWRLDRMERNTPNEETNTPEPSDELAREALSFARQGGIVPYRYRSACQVCTTPAATLAQINIHVLGLPVRQQVLVTVGDLSEDTLLPIQKLNDGKPEDDLVFQHERLLAKMNERHLRTMDRLNQALGGLLPVDVDAVIRVLESCGDCQNCMNVCPICSVGKPQRTFDGHYERKSVVRWLISCAGCGMCEQACPNHMPVSTLFAHIRRQLAEEWDYVPGRAIGEHLPVL